MRNSIKTTSTSLNCLELDNDPNCAVSDIVWRQKKKKIYSYIQRQTLPKLNYLTKMNYLHRVLPESFEILKENIIYYIAEDI